MVEMILTPPSSCTLLRAKVESLTPILFQGVTSTGSADKLEHILGRFHARIPRGGVGHWQGPTNIPEVFFLF